MKIDLFTMWYNEEFLAPFFFSHYRFVDKVTVLLDRSTTDKTADCIEQAQRRYGNIIFSEFSFPDKIDDILKINKFNQCYQEAEHDYVILVDSDEFIFLPPGYLEKNQAIVNFTKLWNVYRHSTDTDLDPEKPILEQRRHGVSDFEGWDTYTKPNLIKAKQDWKWMVGHHAGYLNGKTMSWPMGAAYQESVVGPMPLTGAHWSMADPAFVIERRLKGRMGRQSKVNMTRGFGRQHYAVTEASLLAELKKHENDPLVF